MGGGGGLLMLLGAEKGPWDTRHMKTYGVHHLSLRERMWRGGGVTSVIGQGYGDCCLGFLVHGCMVLVGISLPRSLIRAAKG